MYTAVMQVCEIFIDPIIDGTFSVDPASAYRSGVKGTSGDDWAPHREFLVDGKLEFTLGGFLVRTGDRIALVDTGLGETRSGHGGQLLVELAKLGV
jgi:hypothetical protein